MDETSFRTEARLLDGSHVPSYLRSAGIDVADGADVVMLSGGVSNLVIGIEDPRHRLVLKQSRARLQVSDVWEAPPERIITEAAALRVAARIAPHTVPPVLHVDPDRNILVLERAPAGWTDWKSRLLSGFTDESVGSFLGTWLGTWHRSSEADDGLAARFHHDDAFRALRVDPFYNTTAERAPELSSELLACASEMVTRRLCLVHGDFSPKNVLLPEAPPGRHVDRWVIDFEVTTYGDPTFDLAFLLAHLTLKSLHRPDQRLGYDACATAFLESYAADVPQSLRPEWRYLLRHVACLLLARVRGKSPVDYLDTSGQTKAWQLGSRVLRESPAGFDDLLRIRDEMLR